MAGLAGVIRRNVGIRGLSGRLPGLSVWGLAVLLSVGLLRRLVCGGRRLRCLPAGGLRGGLRRYLRWRWLRD